MPTYRSLLFCPLLMISILTGCSNFVIVEPGALKVHVINLEEAAHCEKLAQTHVKVVTKVGIIKRSRDKSLTEAKNIARNAAVEFSANAVSALNELSEDGKQIFGIYLCH